MGLTVTRHDLPSIEAEWSSLLPACSNGRVFLSPSWLRAWWETFGDGRELLLLAVRDSDRLVAVAPMMRDGARLTFAGNTKVCDYMDFACAAGREAEVLSAVLRATGEEPWDELSLWAMREDSPSLAVLPAVCAELGWSFERQAEDVCPAIDLPAEWEDYIASLDKKHRHELRRKLRKLPQAGQVELEVLESAAEIEGALDDFLRMHRLSRTDKAAFMTDRMEEFFRRLVLSLAADGVVEMVFLNLAGKRAAAVLCFRQGHEMLLYNSGYDPDYAAFSVGLLSKALALQRAIEQGKERFDFLRGPERYKYELGARDLTVYTARVTR